MSFGPMVRPSQQSSPQVHECEKVFIQRDYTNGTKTRYYTQMPSQLDDKIEASAFENMINQLNAFFEEAETATCGTYLEGCLACLTAYLYYICMETHYQKCLKKISRFITDQNEKVFLPRGLLIVNPVERGLRVIEIIVLDQPVLSRP